MAGYNRIVMVGNLTRDPELKELGSGQNVCRLGLAANRQYKNRSTGQQVQEVCFVDIDVWGAQAESCGQYLQKGRPVLIEGRLKFDSWQDPQGGTRSKHSIVADRVVFLSGNESGGDFAAKKDSATSFGTENTDKFSEVAAAVQKKKAVKKAAPKADDTAINFKDQAPFDDEMPF